MNALREFTITNLRVIDKGKLLAAFKLIIPDVGSIDAELFGPRDDGTVWADAHSVKDAGGEYRRTVTLNRELREAVASEAFALYHGMKR